MKLKLAMLALAAVTAGCASNNDVRDLRRPPLPPQYGFLSEKQDDLYQGIVVYEVLGAPEFKLLDNGQVWTTRPRRKDVIRRTKQWLDEARLLASSTKQAQYLLLITFEDLTGPNMIPFADKNATARVNYQIQKIRTKEVIFDETYDADFRTRMPRVTEEMIRAGIVGGVFGAVVTGVANEAVVDDIDVPLTGAAIGKVNGALAGAFAGQVESEGWDWPETGVESYERAYKGEINGFYAGGILGGLASIPHGAYSDAEAAFAGGVVGGLTAMVGAVPDYKETTLSPDPIGSFDGTKRRQEAVYWMLRESFAQFLGGLERQNLIRKREAKTCLDLNPDGFGSAILISNAEEVTYDCPGLPNVLKPFVKGRN